MVDVVFKNKARLILELFEIKYDEADLDYLVESAKKIEISDVVCERIFNDFPMSFNALNAAIIDAMLLVALREEYCEDEIPTSIFLEIPNGRAVNSMITEFLFEKWKVKEAQINFNGLY